MFMLMYAIDIILTASLSNNECNNQRSASQQGPFSIMILKWQHLIKISERIVKDKRSLNKE